jgi:hypothetical protein
MDVEYVIDYDFARRKMGFYGVMVSTLDSESSNLSSNLGRTCLVALLAAPFNRSLRFTSFRTEISYEVD